LLLLAAILVFGFAVRAAWLDELRDSPDLERPPVDGAFTMHWARGLATGDWSLPPEAAGRDPRIRESAFLRAPGYAYLLAATWGWTDGDALAIRKLQMAGGLATLVLAWGLGRRLLGPAFGLAWAASLALCWMPVYYEGGLDETWFLVAGLLAIVLALDRLLERPTLTRALLAGALVALVALFRANLLLAIPVLAIGSTWALRRFGWKRAVAFGGAIALGAALVLAPVVVRNYRVEKAFVPVSTGGGLNLYHANHDGAEAISTAGLGEFGRSGSPWELPDVEARLEAEVGRPLGSAEVSSEFGRRAAAWMRAHPGEVAALMARKLALFFGPREIAHSRAVAADQAMSPLLRRLPLGMPHAVGGALVATLLFGLLARGRSAAAPEARGERGLTLRPHGRGTLLLAAALVAVWTASFLPFVVTSLYRAPIVPLLLGGFAAVAVHVFELARRRDRGALFWGGGLIAAVALAHVPVVEVDPGFDKWHFDRGLASLYAGRPEAARRSFELALEANPRSGAARMGLGKLLHDAGDFAGAELQFRAAAEGDPRDSVALFNLGLTRARLGKWEEAETALVAALRWSPTNADAWRTLGLARDARGLRGGARAAYEETLALRPSDVGAANNLAWILATAPESELRDGTRAVALLESYARSDDPTTLDTLAAAYAETGRYAEAIATAERALARMPPEATAARRETSARLEEYRAGRPHRAGAAPSG
jgi:Flp pilus assembly protein TadD